VYYGARRRILAAFMLAQLSDPHIRMGEGEREAAQALAAAVAAVNAVEPAPDAVLVSGDLADHGDPREYARVKELLAPLAMPVYVLAGNHDDVAALEAVFGPAEYAVRAGPLRLIGLDSTLPDADSGRVPVDRLAQRLEEDTETPTIVAMHHAPLLTGVAPMDALGVPDADRRALAALLARHPQVLRVVCGHVHRAIVGALGGVPVFACPGSHLQLELDFGAGAELAVTGEPPGFALHVLLDGALTTHVQML
jgi:3',5'-cyclic AMP phosphodiesterase CpdA